MKFKFNDPLFIVFLVMVCIGSFVLMFTDSQSKKAATRIVRYDYCAILKKDLCRCDAPAKVLWPELEALAKKEKVPFLADQPKPKCISEKDWMQVRKDLAHLSKLQ